MAMNRHPYATEAYARALAAGDGLRPIDVPEWASFVLARPVAGDGEDAAGPYPRTPLGAEADLEAGLRRLADENLVSVVLVTDPLSAPLPHRLTAAFDPCRPFKTHQLIDRARGAYAPSRHHRYEIRRAFSRCATKRVDLAVMLEPWITLYNGLIDRRAITGAATFSPAYFAMLAQDPTFVAFAATAEDRLVAMAIWFEHQGAVYNHLGASSEAGYAAGAGYALYDAAIAHFADAAVIDLGGGAGTADNPDDGLARFKRGFANSQAEALLCGVVFDRARYERLADGRRTSFFPAYRG